VIGVAIWSTVSILARPARAGRRSTSFLLLGKKCFNPRPAREGRASVKTRSYYGPTEVSILARPARAGRLGTNGHPELLERFQSSPGPRGPGVASARSLRWWDSQFQSSPGPRGPGVLSAMLCLGDTKGFNPRPAREGRASG